MTDQEKRELDVKLATHFWGIKKIYYGEWDEDKSWPLYIPSGKPWRTHKIDAKPIPRFTDSLDACFQLLVPKLMELNKGATVGQDKVGGSYAAIFVPFAEECEIEIDHEETVSLALCLAVEQLIDKEGK